MSLQRHAGTMSFTKAALLFRGVIWSRDGVSNDLLFTPPQCLDDYNRHWHRRFISRRSQACELIFGHNGPQW